MMKFQRRTQKSPLIYAELRYLSSTASILISWWREREMPKWMSLYNVRSYKTGTLYCQDKFSFHRLMPEEWKFVAENCLI